MTMKFSVSSLFAGSLSVAVLLGGTGAVCAADPAPAASSDGGWPRVYVQAGATNTIYQPQVDSWDGFQFKARAAVAIQATGAPEPTFGVVEITARTLVDKVQRTVWFDECQVPSAKFPSAPEREAAYLEQLRKVIPNAAESMSLDRLEASLAISEETKKARSVPIQNQPPRIIFAQRPALLVPIDGEPAWRPVAGSSVQRVLNTRVLLLKDASGRIYLHLWDGYLEAPSLNGPWTVAKQVPSEVKKAEKLAADSKQVDLLAGEPDPETKKTPSLKTTPLPVIYTSTSPAELIVTAGVPNWVPINGTMLLFVTNSANDVFKCLTDQQTYVLMSGRWFRSPGFEGPWQYVPGASLPADFAQMPDASPKENVKASVPGTPQAKEMLIANSIPQTAANKRDATLDPVPQLDGPTQLQTIAGTPLSYVVNSPTPIIRVDDKSWYACQNGVWFVATSVTGPWVVATSVPAVIYSIPPTCPVHYVTYVRISTVTPSLVYVGYTPGYLGSVVSSDGVVVYGTGYYYTPWVGTIYVTSPVTYGYCAVPAWSPWTGWAFGFSVGWACGPYWYGGWYCPPPPCWGPYWGHWGGGWKYNAWGGVTVWGPGGWAGTSGNIYHQWGNWSGVSRVQGGYNAWTGNQWASKYGTAYNSRTGTIAAGQRGAVQNVYTGNYAYGGRGAAYNPNTGVAAAGGKVTVGNRNTGNDVTAGRVTVGKPGQGSTTISGVKGDSGGVYRAGDHVVATKDGNVYKPTGNGGWQQVTPSGNRSAQYDSQRTQSFQNEIQARSQGQQRSESFDSFRSSAGGNSYSRGGGGGYQQRSYGGGGGGGGFRGGGRR